MAAPVMEKENEKDAIFMRRLRTILDGEQLTKAEFVKSFESVAEFITRIGKKLKADIETFRSEFALLSKRIEDSNKEDIESIKEQARTSLATALQTVLSKADDRLNEIQRIAARLRDGKDADEEAMLVRLTAMIPTIEQLAEYLPKAGTDIRNALELLQGDERLDITSIKGWEKLAEDIEKAKKSGKPVNFVGGARGIYVYIGGVKKGIVNTMNFVAGAGLAIAYSKVNGLDTLTLSVSGSGVTVETPPEAPNAVIVEFTVSGQPKWIVADGTTYYEGAGYSYNSGTGKVTMDIPPSSFIRAII